MEYKIQEYVTKFDAVNSSLPTPADHNTEDKLMYEKEKIYSYDDGYIYEFYNYSYDYDSSVDYKPLGEFIPMVSLYCLVGLLGLVGNLLVIFSIIKIKRMRSITNLFLLSLASADLLLVCVCVPLRVSHIIYVYLI